jgi:hypothetical protein
MRFQKFASGTRSCGMPHVQPQAWQTVVYLPSYSTHLATVLALTIGCCRVDLNSSSGSRCTASLAALACCHSRLGRCARVAGLGAPVRGDALALVRGVALAEVELGPDLTEAVVILAACRM